MGRRPCCSKEGLNRGAWTAQEDKILRDYIQGNGEGKWRNLPQRAGLKRCGKSCRLRWVNYLRSDIKRGNISQDEEDLIIRLHKLLGNRWSLIAGRIPGRTDNEIKNYWNTNLAKKVRDGNSISTSKVVPPTLISANQDSHVIRPKASKCSKKLFIDPPTFHSPTQIDHSNYYMTEQNADAEINILTTNKMEYLETGRLGDGLIDEKDLLFDFNIEDVCLHDLLNSDFSEACGLSYNNDVDQLPFLDQPLVSTVGDCLI